MLETIRMHVLMPLMGRLGTITATALAPLGVHADLAHQIGIGVTALGLVMFDLVVSYVNRRAVENRAMAQGASAAFEAVTGVPGFDKP